MARKGKSDSVSQQGKLWVQWADWDWVAARVLYLQKNPKFWPSAGLLGHKSLEQYLKALLRSHGVKTEWSGLKGHNLVKLGSHCQRYEPWFAQGVVRNRLSIFNDIYRGWRYPAEIKGQAVSGEVLAMGDNHLIELDETVAEIRPRIQMFKLGLPLTTFEECNGALAEGPSFVEWAKKENATFERMEQSSRNRSK